MKDACCRCSYPAKDFCSRCGEPYCEGCMAAGCCGVAPAESGVEEEFANQYDVVCTAHYGDLGLPREDVVSRC